MTDQLRPPPEGADTWIAGATQTATEPGIRRLDRTEVLPARVALMLAIAIRNVKAQSKEEDSRGENTTPSLGGSEGVQEVPNPNRFHGENPRTVFDSFSTGMPGAIGGIE